MSLLRKSYAAILWFSAEEVSNFLEPFDNIYNVIAPMTRAEVKLGFEVSTITERLESGQYNINL